MGRSLRRGAFSNPSRNGGPTRNSDPPSSRFPVTPPAPARPRRLPRRFEREGHILRLVVRTNQAAVYAQSVSGKVVAYEVYRVRICPAVTLKGRHYPCREVLPRDEHWGSYAWTFVTLAEARARYDALAGR